MKTNEDISRFIELRGKGYSYAKIAQQINVSKPVLLKWGAEYQAAVKIAEALFFQGILEQYEVLRSHRVSVLSATLQVALTELKSRDYTDMKTGSLLNVVLQLEERLKQETLVEVEVKNGKVDMLLRDMDNTLVMVEAD